jgi:hypothetical protein
MNITGPARLIPAIALGALFATQAPASDVYHLSTHGDWTVSLESDDSLACAASTTNRSGEIFDMTIRQDGSITMFIIFDGNPGMKQINMDVVIAGVTTWEMDNVTFTEYGAWFRFDDTKQGVAFMGDLQNGQSVAITRPRDAQIVTSWSLRGSRDAIAALADCFKRIVGAPA